VTQRKGGRRDRDRGELREESPSRAPEPVESDYVEVDVEETTAESGGGIEVTEVVVTETEGAEA
jgi:hypothetical protein